MLLILQWNCRSIQSNIEEFKQYVSNLSTQPDIICLQETFLRAPFNISLQNYDIIRYDRNCNDGPSRGGLAILIRKGIISYNVIKHKDIECVSVMITTNKGDVKINNVYLPPSKDLKYEELECLFNTPNTITVGDFNGKSPLWGNTNKDRRGGIIEQLLDNHNMVLLNNGDPTHFSIHGQSALDLSLCSPELALFSSWEVDDQTCGSDHYIINISIGVEIQIQEVTKPRWIFKKAKWNIFCKLCDENLKAIEMLQGNINSNCNAITEAIIKAANNSIPKSKGSGKSNKYKIFWSPECKEATKNRDKYRRIFRKSKSEEDYLNYKKHKALATKVIKAAKRQKWRDFCSTLNYRSDLTKVWKVVKSYSKNIGDTNIPYLKHNNEFIKDSIEKANLFAKQFSHISSSENYDKEFLTHKVIFENEHADLFMKQSNDEKAFNIKFTHKELQKVLKKTKITTPGADMLSYEMFKHMSEYGKEIVLTFINKIWNTGDIPDAWRHAIIIPILKPGQSKHIATSYRPIALTSNFSKIMEKLIVNRLKWHLEKHKLLNNFQSGFRKKGIL